MDRRLAAALIAASFGCHGQAAIGPGPTGTPATTPSSPSEPDPPPTDLPGDTGAPGSDPLGPDYRPPGPYAVDEGSARLSPSPRCTTDYRTYLPRGVPLDTVVVLAHGFSRNQGAVADLAAHIASWGLPVATIDLCHSTPIGNDPLQDGADLVALADALGADRRIYVGHSAGGLRSVLAATLDPDAVAVLGLDLVDLDDLALDAAPSLSIPVYGLLGEPYTCNESGNGLPVYQAAADSTAIWVHEADHCDFEWPTGPLCTTFCSEPSAAPEARIRDTIRSLATAFPLWQSGVDPLGERWWVPGNALHDALVASGAITVR